MTLLIWRRRLRAILTAGRTIATSPGRTWSAFWREQSRALTAAFTLVRVFYLCMFFIQLQLYPNWNEWLKLKSLHLLWPVGWFEWIGIGAGVVITVFGSLAASILAAALPAHRFARALAALFILFFGAFFNSFGSANHGWHAWIWTAVIFVFLPNGSLERVSSCTSLAQRYLRVIFFAQALNLLFYTSAGAFKLAGAFVQMTRGEVHAFHPHALARHIANRIQQGTAPTDYALGTFIIDYPYAGWPIYLAGLYIEFFSLLVAFRPSAHRMWGVMLILFHFGIHLLMTIMFSWHMLVVGLLFIASPFAPSNLSLRAAFCELPIIGDVMAWFRCRARAVNVQRRAQLKPDPVL